MTPPINIDGSTVDAITIDGTEVTEVTADGEVVFGSAIPDSAVSQFTFDEGTGTTVTNEYSSKPDGALNGASWVSDSNLTGDYGINFDGTDDRIDLDSRHSFWAPGSESITIAMTVNMADLTQDQLLWGWSNGSDDYTIGTSDNSDGKFAMAVYDGSWALERSADIANNPNIDGTSRLRLACTFENKSTGQIYVNGTQVDDGNEDSYSMGTDVEVFGYRTDGFYPANVIIDNVIYYDAVLSDSEMQVDYDAQPWS